ncbi:hypothetical protein MBANPS3_001706 [Mucor bainieri]
MESIIDYFKNMVKGKKSKRNREPEEEPVKVMKKKKKNKKKQKNKANEASNTDDLNNGMPGTFPLPSPPTTPPTMIILSDDEEDENSIETTETHKENEVLYTTTNKISLTDRDLQTLQPGKWLNDTIIDFTLKTIEDRYRCSDFIFVSSSFFFTRLKSAKA